MEITHSEASQSEVEKNPRLVFRSQLKPAILKTREARDFRRVTRGFEATLNDAVWDSSLHEKDRDVVQSARFVVGNISARRRTTTAEAEKAVPIHTKNVSDWFSKKYPGTETLLSSYFEGDEQKQAKLQTLMGTIFSHWINVRNSMGAVFRKDLEKRYLQEMAVFLLRNAPAFHNLSKITSPEGSILDNVDQAERSTSIDVQILERRSDVAAFATKDWIAETALAARSKGLKVYNTPFYETTIDDLHFRENVKNGVGGVILYGPPGTGKTELLTEKNRRMGYETRVISIHHYTSFEDLIAGKLIQLGLERGSAVAQQIKTVLDVFEKEDPDQFKNYISTLFSQLQKEGKIRSNETVTDFLSSFISEDTKKRFEKRELSTDDWQEIKTDFIQTQKARMLRTILPSSYQEIVEDIVRGEILLAMQKGERVTLDELDKAGPNSLGGILTFLAKSPGEYLEYGQAREKIPSWFRIDATSNSSILNEYLKNRFGHKRIDTPPIKDQLMITAVRVADHQGNILLNEYEQRQMVGFFTYMVPEINKILIEGKSAPLSNRDIQHLTSYLVDFAAMKRTRVTFNDAIKRFLEERTLTMANIKQPINKLIMKFDKILRDKPYDFRQAATPTPVITDRKTSMLAGMEEGVRAVMESPMILAINGLGESDIDTFERPVIHEVVLSNEQKRAAGVVLKRKKEEQTPLGDMMKLSIGMVIEKTYDEKSNKAQLKLWAADEDDKKTHELAVREISFDGRLVGASADGKFVVLAGKSNNPDQEKISVVDLFQNEPVTTSEQTFSKDSIIKTGSTNKVYILDTSTHCLSLMEKNNQTRIIGSRISGFEVSNNGNLILVEFDNKTSSLISPDSNTPIAHLAGKSWSFVGDKLIIQDVNGVIAENGYVLN